MVNKLIVYTLMLARRVYAELSSQKAYRDWIESCSMDKL